jgi:hypothetical protein
VIPFGSDEGRILVRLKMIFLVTSIVIAAATPTALAKSFPAGGITRDEMAAYLVKHGYSATPAYESGNEHNILKTTIDGVNVDIYFLDCKTDDKGRCASVQFATSWSMSSPDLELVNSWNRDKRFMRAYLTTTKSTLWAEYDMFIAPNGSTALLDKNVDMWKALIKGLKAHFNF